MIKTSILLQDNFTPVITGVMDAINQSINTMADLHNTVSKPVDTAIAEGISDDLADATAQIQQFNQSANNIRTPTIDMEVKIPKWESPSFEVFNSSGVERYKSEINSANQLLYNLNKTQLSINNTASQVDILPDSMVNDLNNTQVRINNIKSRIMELSRNPLNLASPEDSAELESLRIKLSQAVSEQNQLNTAVKNLDVESANRSYQKLNSTINSVEMQIRDNINGQDKFNRKLQEGQSPASKLVGMIKGAVGAYLTLNVIKSTLNIADSLASTDARLQMMVRDGEQVDDVMNKIYASAERSRGSFQDTANAVAKLGNTAGDAFTSTDEIIAFTEQLNKQFVMAGTDATGISSAMLQLTQAMGAGVLRGEEFNSVIEQAPGIIELIADRMGVPKGEMKQLASEGKITANIIKDALLSSANKTNAVFNQMPMTFGQAWASVKNTALMAFSPVLKRISSITQSQAFLGMMESVKNGIVLVANAVNWLFDIIAPIGKFIADNWSIISPILLGVAAAVGFLTTAFLLHKVSILLVAVATAIWNSALWSSPVLWITVAIIALIAVIFAVANAIVKFTGITTSGFGLICGAINVVIQWFVNLWHLVLNVCYGIGNAINALGYNIETAFHNAISNVQSWFYDLLATALNVISGIGNALNKLPFVNIDMSGVQSLAVDYANKSAQAQSGKKEYKDVGTEFMAGFNTHEVFADGWVQDAFNSGAAWGDNLLGSLESQLAGLTSSGIPDINDYGLDTSTSFPEAVSGGGAGLDDIGSGVKDIAENTGAIKDTLEISEEDLKYLRDIAERETINRFTTAEIKVDMGGITNNVASGTDLDGIIDKLTTGVYDAMSRVAEGVHV